MMRILSITSLYPNAIHPNHGVFIENRLRYLRETGEISGYNRGFTGKDRSNFLDVLERTVQSAKRTL